MSLPSPSPSSTCLVTGASSGIGAEVARQLSRRGHHVTLVARREERLRELAAELGDADVRASDVSDAAAREALVQGLSRNVDVLVNNAGFSTSGPLWKSERQRELAMVRTNVEAVVDLCALLVPGMVERGQGAVLNVASTAAFQPLPMQAGYAASKAFVLSFSEAIHAELHGTAVAVTALCPGPVDTEFMDVANLPDAGQSPGFLWADAEEVARAGVEGLERGKRVVIPGLLNRAGAIGGQHAPRSLILRLAARMHPAGR